MTTSDTITKISPQAWDELRLSFQGSVMVDIPLTSLAQNIDGCFWDIPGDDETPAAYIDLTYREVIDRLRSKQMPVVLIDNLADILRHTLAFDDSFGAMVEVAGKAEVDPIARNLARLHIPGSFPIQLCALDSNTLSFCRRESIDTLAAFLNFARSATRHVVVGGEFRDLLNAISHVDEAALARYLPFRPRFSGLHLVESLALLVRPLSLEDRMSVARDPTAAEPRLLYEAKKRMDYFADSTQRLRSSLSEGTPLSRLVVSLDDLSLEAAVASLLGHLLTPQVPAPAPVPAALKIEPVQKKKSLLRFLGL